MSRLPTVVCVPRPTSEESDVGSAAVSNHDVYDGSQTQQLQLQLQQLQFTDDGDENNDEEELILSLRQEVEKLQGELRNSKEEIRRQADIINEQYEQMSRMQIQLNVKKQKEREMCGKKKQHCQKHLKQLKRGRSNSLSTANSMATPTETTTGLPSFPSSSSFKSGISSSEIVMEEMQQWLFLEGGKFKDLSTLIKEYCSQLNEIADVPVARFFTGIEPHLELNKMVFKWEEASDEGGEPLFFTREVQMGAFKKMKNSKEPLVILRMRQAKSVRLRASLSDEELEEHGCGWFRPGNYQDYFALPVFCNGEYKGAACWATKQIGGFTDDEIEILRRSWTALSTVIRLYTNDTVLRTLTGRLEAQVNERTAELAHANRELNLASEQIAAHAKQQLRHFAMMSHEIRTPLNCILGISELILQDKHRLDPDLLESMEMIYTSGDLLLAVVNDVLDYSKLAYGAIELKKESRALRPTIKTVARTLKVRAKEKGLDFRLKIAQGVPISLNTDHRRVQQILYNLVGNAIKYGADGNFVELSIQKTATTILKNNVSGSTSRQGAAIRFSVTDQGRGLSKEEIEKVFLPFQRLQSDSQESGTGLGLTIVSKIVQALGGDIGVESELGEGSTFSFTLPLSSDDTCSSSNNVDDGISTSWMSEVTPTVGSLPDDSSNIESLRVLIADDNLVNRKVAKRSLERLGVKEPIDLAHDGKQAVDMTLAKEYDLVLMDLQMPVMDGLEATRIITSRQSDHQPVIIFLTAHAGPDFEAKTREAGGAGHITKPFKLAQIKSVLAETAYSDNWINGFSDRAAQ